MRTLVTIEIPLGGVMKDGRRVTTKLIVGENFKRLNGAVGALRTNGTMCRVSSPAQQTLVLAGAVTPTCEERVIALIPAGVRVRSRSLLCSSCVVARASLHEVCLYVRCLCPRTVLTAVWHGSRTAHC
jgi:hypothetical protein